MRRNWLTICTAAVVIFPLLAGTTVVVGTDPSKHVLKGKLVTSDQIIEGELVIEGDTITCLAANCDDPPGASVFTITAAYIFPGFVDAHNHVAYNVLPKWAPPKVYQNRAQWQGTQAYKEAKKPYAVLKDQEGLFCEMVKYGELRALLSGITTIQGTAPGSPCIRTLIRNAENQNELGLHPSHIRTFVPNIDSFTGAVDWSVTKSFVVHLGEGVDENSRKEFDTLKSKGLLTAQTAIIHGTAFGAAEFTEMAAVGAKLIWSPQSNLALYGKTTNVKLARDSKVEVSLGVDWNLSGSNNMFDELRVAARVNEEEFAGAVPASEWVRMITANPAKALALEAHLGRLAPGLKADITVLRAHDPEPGRSLLRNHPEDVEMVWVAGELLYGSRTVLETVKPGQCEDLKVNGSSKRVCVPDTKDPAPNSSQKLADIQKKLQAKHPQLPPLVP